MNDDRSDFDLWKDEDAEDEDEEQTQVARNPTLRDEPSSPGSTVGSTAAASPTLPPPASLPPTERKSPQTGPIAVARVALKQSLPPPAIVEERADDRSDARGQRVDARAEEVERDPDALTSPKRTLSSFSPKASGERRSLYERLVESGALEEVMAIAAAEATQRPIEASAEEPERDPTKTPTVRPPQGVLESHIKASTPVPPLPPVPTDILPTPTRGLRAVDLDDDSVVGPNPDDTRPTVPSAETEAGRVSSEPLSDGDLYFMAADSRPRRESDGFVRALDIDPDVDEPPVVGRFKRPAELTPPGLQSGDPDRFRSHPAPQAPPPLVKPQPLPSVVLSPQISMRNDSTERVSTLPKTHPLANSVAPTAAPRTERPAEDRKSSGWLLGLVAAAIVGGVVAVAGYKLPQEHTPSALASADHVQTVTAEATPAPVVAPAPVVTPVPPTPPVEEPKVAAATVEPEAEREHHHRRRDRTATEGTEGTAPPAAVEPAATAAVALAADAPSAAKPEKSSHDGEAKPAVVDPNLPTQPTRDQVVAAMNSVMPRLQECVGDKHGTANVSVTVRGAGFVSYALVAGTFVGTPEGSCIARVVKEAQFPPFAEPFIRVTYPYQL